MTAIVFLVLIGLVVLALQRNHQRQRYHRQSLAGGAALRDRDSERVLVELTAARH